MLTNGTTLLACSTLLTIPHGIAPLSRVTDRELELHMTILMETVTHTFPHPETLPSGTTIPMTGISPADLLMTLTEVSTLQPFKVTEMDTLLTITPMAAHIHMTT